MTKIISKPINSNWAEKEKEQQEKQEQKKARRNAILGGSELTLADTTINIVGVEPKVIKIVSA